MFSLVELIRFVKSITEFGFYYLKTRFMSHSQIQMEILALRSQLALQQEKVINHKQPRRRPTPFFRFLWVFLSKRLVDWKSVLIVVKPETVVGWHRTWFKFFFRFYTFLSLSAMPGEGSSALM